MKHCIVAKFCPGVQDKKALTPEIAALFARAAEIPGVTGAKVIENCVDRENRYDLMIVVDMARDALPAWDASQVHNQWKKQYGPLLQSKAIFDCESF